MAFPNLKKKKNPDFLDEVVDDMGEEDGSTKYGADMSEADDMDEGGDPEVAKEDRIMAAKLVAKALGNPNVDAAKFADALESFVKAC
jgi:hypothetical protein